MLLVLCLFLGFLPALALAADEDVSFFDCPDVRFFGPRDCPQAPAPEPSPSPGPQAPSVRTDVPGVLLFPKETLAPSTPPLMVDLLENPTVENAVRFLLWQRERQERSKLVQELLKALSARE